MTRIMMTVTVTVDMVMMIMKRIPPRHDSFVLRALLVCTPLGVLSGYSNLTGAFTPRGLACVSVQGPTGTSFVSSNHTVQSAQTKRSVCNRACDTWQAAVWAKCNLCIIII